VKLRARRAVARLLRSPLVRYARAEPRPEAWDGADRRIFIVLSTAWGMGGTIRTTLNLAAYLARSRDVEIISVGRWRDKPFFGDFPPGVRVVTLADRRRSARRPIARRLLSRVPSVLMPSSDAAAGGFDLWVDIKLARHLRRKTGILMTTRPGLNVAAVRLGLPGMVLVGQEHMHLRHHNRALQRAILRFYPRLDVLTVLTHRDLDVYRERLGDRLRLVRIANTVRDMGPGRADLSSKTILAAGRLNRQKGYDMLIEAFAGVAEDHPDWRLRICGDGPLKADLQRMIDAHGLADAVVLAGPARDLGAEMTAASMFVLSSRWEGLPLVLLEAMSKGMAIAAFDCETGPRDVVDDRRNGLLADAGDVGALATAIRELIEDEPLRRRCAEGALATAAEYGMDHIGPQWTELLAGLAPRGARAR
jgi:glycosyltransferase involved in cell wall biosynthesis